MMRGPTRNRSGFRRTFGEIIDGGGRTLHEIGRGLGETDAQSSHTGARCLRRIKSAARQRAFRRAATGPLRIEIERNLTALAEALLRESVVELEPRDPKQESKNRIEIRLRPHDFDKESTWRAM
jgi:hypothetical protein